MFNQPTTYKQSPPQGYTHPWVRWLAVWLIGIGIGLPLMLIIAGSGSQRAVNTLVRTGMLAISGPAFQTYVVADTLSRWLIALLPGATSGAVIGLGQWVVLPQRLRPIHTWLLASACGGAIAWWSATALVMPMQVLVMGLLHHTVMLDLSGADILIAALVTGGSVGYLGGALAGSAQWLILRRVSPFAVGWIIATAIGWSSMWAAGTGILAIITLQSPAI